MTILPPALDKATIQRRQELELAALARAPKLIPPIGHPVRPVGGAAVGWWSVQVTPTAGAWVPVWRTWAPAITHQALLGFVVATTDATGDGDFRLSLTGTRGNTPETLNSGFVTASFGGTLAGAEIRWLHLVAPWSMVDVTLTLEARVRTNRVDVFPPYGGELLQVDPEESAVA